MNEIASSSTYMIDSIDLWHGKLGHVSILYVKKMQSLSLISSIKNECFNKCEICVETKSTKKTCI